MRRILVTGALGQIGSELVPSLRQLYGDDLVVASDLASLSETQGLGGRYEQLDCTDAERISTVMRRHEIGVVYHLAALLSAVAEGRPQAAWNINLGGVFNLLEAARQFGARLFVPSSIAAFGPSTPRDDTPQITVQRPTTIYGVTKVAGELLCDYYAKRFAVDVRGVRFPGLISYIAPPGGGVTDYAVEMFRAALTETRYACFLAANTRLDMMYMPDAITAMIKLMDADTRQLKHRNAYNVTAMSITPAELAAEIRKHLPDFTVEYQIDEIRQSIANSWPRSLDARAARNDWQFSARFDLSLMTADMIARIKPTTCREEV